MNRRKGKYRFNIIDVLLITVIVVSALAIAFLVYNNRQDNTESSLKKVKIMYTLEDEAIDDILRGKVDIGNKVFTSDGSSQIGEVVDVEYSDAEYNGFDSEKNQSFTSVLPGHLDMRIVISANATVDNDGVYYVNGIRLNMGAELDVRFPFYTGNTVCVSVSEVNE